MMAKFFFLTMALTIASLNVRSLKAGFRKAVIMVYLGSVKTDVICVQECGVEDLHGIVEWGKGMAVWAPC